MSFGINPRRGGRPPRDKRRTAKINEIFWGDETREGNCLIE